MIALTDTEGKSKAKCQLRYATEKTSDVCVVIFRFYGFLVLVGSNLWQKTVEGLLISIAITERQ